MTFYTVIAAFGILLLFIYCWFYWNFKFWDDRRIPGPKPKFLFGNTPEIFLKGYNSSDMIQKLYLENKHERFVGFFAVVKKILLINDLDLMRSILVKDFDYFHDRGMEVNATHDPLMLHLFNLQGRSWKNLRDKLTPTFTSSKMKFMFHTLMKCNEEMISFINDKLAASNSQVYDVEARELFGCLNTDIVGSCAFGIECNSFKYPDAEFRVMGKKIITPHPWQLLKSLIIMLIPNAMEIFNIGFMNKRLTEYFCNIVVDTIKQRKEKNIVRNDFLQILIDLQGDTDEQVSNEPNPDVGTHLTTMQIAAQVFVFFVAGFETSSTVASFALYELALNPDIQNKLREEIDEVTESHNGDVTYEALGEMPYLSQVVDETLRKYPPVPVLFRACNKDYTIPGTDIKIEKGIRLVIPIHGIHRDPDLYPDPMKFDPERFTPENKATRHHFAYMPFGEGPRICIANRFGLMQTKLGLVSILSKYKVSPCEKTLIPMEYESKSFVLSPKDGTWLRLSPRRYR